MTKKLLFILFAFVALSVSAQNQTVTIDWSFGSNSNATGPNNNADFNQLKGRLSEFLSEYNFTE